MFTLLFVLLVVGALVGVVSVFGVSALALDLGKALFYCALVVVLISAVVGIARGRARA